LVARLGATERALAEGRYVAIADVDYRWLYANATPTTEMNGLRKRIMMTPDYPFLLRLKKVKNGWNRGDWDYYFFEGAADPSMFQAEVTAQFLGRSVASIIADLGIESVLTSPGSDEIRLVTKTELGSGFEQRFTFGFERSQGKLLSKSREIRFRRPGAFLPMNVTSADDFREVAAGLWLPHRVVIDYHDYKPETPDDAIPPLASKVRVDIVGWKPMPEGTGEEEEEPQEPAEEADDDEPLEAAEEPDAETEEGMEEEGDAPEENEEEGDDEPAEGGEDPASEAEDESGGDEESPEPNEEEALEAIEEMEESDFEPEEEADGKEDAPDERTGDETEAILLDADPSKV